MAKDQRIYELEGMLKEKEKEVESVEKRLGESVKEVYEKRIKQDGEEMERLRK